MLLRDDSDTIAALSTSPGECGIAIIRISGKNALGVADRVFRTAAGGKPSELPSHSLNYGWVVEASGQAVDEAMLGIMKAPRSYTREDVVEINCHGGVISSRRILDLLLQNGCRPAEPGEFTKRAFLNGRIDLSQAEAVMDVIGARTEAALRSGVMHLKGGLSARIMPLRAELLDLLAELEAAIDFPEEEAYGGVTENAPACLEKAIEGIRFLIETSRCGIPLSEGASVAICGRPNTGKSSLLNALLKRERSIVTHIAGTTRDTVEEDTDIKGIPVRLIDTAGIKEPQDAAERKAVLRSRRYMDFADAVLLLFDGGRKLEADDRSLIRRLSRKKNVLAVVNKCDLRLRAETGLLEKAFGEYVSVSAKKGLNLGLLEEKIAGRIFKGRAPEGGEVFISSRRHLELLRRTERHLCAAGASFIDGLSPELTAQDIKDALAGMDSILGLDFSGDVLKRIFGRFCIGK